jgi:hypothetical protein
MFIFRARHWAVICLTPSIALARVTTSQVCSPETIPYPELLGIEITPLYAYERHNHSIDLPFGGTLIGLNFCNVSISYTHPGADDSISVQVWFPLKE